jgi:uncharacterized protein YcbK (DUF882 family)
MVPELNVYPYFTNDELKCKCGCEEMGMEPDFMSYLVALREAYGKPMPLSSAYRCKEHPIERSKRTLGPHTTGRAVDVLVFGKNAVRLLRMAQEMGFNGIGVSQKGSHNKRFLHLDMAPETPTRPRPWMWSY